MSNFPTKTKTLANGLVIEIRTYSMHWGLRVMRNGSVMATHSGNKKNMSYQRKLIDRYSKFNCGNPAYL